jgi:hypothetical protein
MRRLLRGSQADIVSCQSCALEGVGRGSEPISVFRIARFCRHPARPVRSNGTVPAGVHLAVDRATDMSFVQMEYYSPSRRIHVITALKKIICDAFEK